MKTRTRLIRALSLLLALLLLLSLAPTGVLAAAVVTTVASDATDEDSDRATDVVAIGETLYLLCMDSFKRQPVTGGESETLGEVYNTTFFVEPPQNDGTGWPTVDRLFVMDDSVYGLCTLNGAWYRLVDESGAFVAKKQPSTLKILLDDAQMGSLYLSSACAMGGKLYLTGLDYTASGMSFACSVDLATGERSDLKTKNVYLLAPWSDTLLGCYLYDVSLLLTGATQSALEAPVTFGLYDPAADALTASYEVTIDHAMGGYAVGGLCGDGSSLFYKCGGRVYGLDMATGESRTSAYTGEGMLGGASQTGGTCCVAGRYVQASNGLTVLELDTDAVNAGALRIFGQFGTETHRAFVKAHPEIPVDVSGEYTADIEALSQAMLSENETYDVLMLNLAYMPVDRLISKGYATDLSGYPEIADRVAEMLPAYRDACMMDGKLYAAPVDMSATTFSVDMELWEELGLAEDDLPATWVELFDFFANWMYDYGEDHEDIKLFSYGQAEQLLFSLLINQYIAYPQVSGDKMRFDTPMFRELMTAFKAIDFDEQGLGAQDGAAMSYVIERALFDPAYLLGYFGYSGDGERKPLFLSLQDGVEPYIPANVTVMVINPKTKRMDDAVAYVSYYLDHLDASSANVTLYPDHNEPVISDENVKAKAEYQKQLEDAQARYEAASEENKAGIQGDIDDLNAAIQDIEKYLYTVTAEELDYYRQNVEPLLFPLKQSALTGADSGAIAEVNALLMQYFEDAMDLDAIVKELDQRVNLMELEDQ